MTLTQRFMKFGMGVGIGLVFIAMAFGPRAFSCNYFPNARVLNNLRNKPLHYSEKASHILTEKWVDTADIKNSLKFGDVDFDKSNIEFKKGKLYVIEGNTVKNQEIILKVINYENKAVLDDIIKIEKK